jgi:glyoxylase-like metal-dependent hydrolase (beta-lactamase superfamily II)
MSTFLQLRLGGDRNFCYLVGEAIGGLAAVIDPGHDPDRLHAIAAEHGWTITEILVTHGHDDHVGGVARLVELTGAAVWAGAGERLSGVRPLADHQRIPVGHVTIEALSTPGHTCDHYCFLFGDRLVTGDLLFCGKVGGTGTSFPGSSPEQEWVSLRRIRELPGAIRVYPGHDYYGGPGEMPFSTVGHELLHNPFLMCEDFAAFVRLKENWAAYKKEHGLR